MSVPVKEAGDATGVATRGPSRIPSLDGLRAIAIGLVLVAHASHSFPHGVWIDRATFVIANGGLGVSIFFVISGYLITTLLMAEEVQTGRISLGDFYLRRAFRILPAYYCYLLVVAALSLAGFVQLSGRALAAAVAFVTDYVAPGATDWVVGHTWSLSVEEQFYLFWPAFMAFFGMRGATRIAILLIVVSPVLRGLHFSELPELRGRIPFALHTRVDSLMFGSLAALLGSSPAFRNMCRRVWSSKLHVIGTAFVVLILPRIRNIGHGALIPAFSYSIEGIVITFFLLWVVQAPETMLGRFLNTRAMVFVGTMSYSLYLWQQPFMRPDPVGWMFRIPWNIAIVGVLATASYFFIEKPFLRVRSRMITRRADAGSDPNKHQRIARL